MSVARDLERLADEARNHEGGPLSKPSMAGEYYDPLPVDFLILERLPEQGMVGGVHWKGRRVRDVAQDLKEVEGIDASLITVDLMSARVRSMRAAGLVKEFGGFGSKNDGSGLRIWARTPKGTAYLGNKEQILS